MAAEYPGDGDLARSRVVATRSRGLGCGKPLCVNGYSDDCRSNGTPTNARVPCQP